MKKWQKLIREITRTPGPIRVQLFLLTTLTASSVLSTGLQIYKLGSNTSVENTSYRKENPKEEREELLVSLIGRSIMEVPQNSRPTYPPTERRTFPERSYPYIHPSERPTTRKPDNYSFIMSWQKSWQMIPLPIIIVIS